MSNPTQAIVQKRWSYCHVLRDDGLSYGDYVEQPTYRAYSYEELLQRDKVSLDIFWLKDESLEDSANLPEPHVLAADIVEDLRTALEQFEAIQADLSRPVATTAK
jgi:hypothetical protein